MSSGGSGRAAAEEAPVGVLLLAYGAVEDVDDLDAYYTDIRHGRTPSPEMLADLRERYEAIGGSSPLRDITFRQAGALERRLDDGSDRPFRVFVGMRHWHPFIREVVTGEIAESSVDPLVTLVLAPHYSRMSVGAYYQRLDEALERLEDPPTVLRVRQYHDHPAFIADVAGAVADKLEEFDAGADRVKVLFTAHSLPERILETGDPYKDQLLESCRRVADELGGLDWDFAFQSAASTGVPWLGPDVLDVLPRLAAEGHERVLVVPIGFICDHLEILYDVDVECVDVAREHGLELKRTEMPNDRPTFIAALEAIVRERLEAGR